MKTIYSILLLILCTSMSLAQSDLSSPKKVTNEYWELERTKRSAKFEIGGGLFIPQGKLADFIKPSPFVGLELYIPTERNKSISIIAQFVIPSQNNPFVIQSPNTIEGVEPVSSDLIINSFVRFSQNLTSTDSTNKIELGLGVGISTMLVQTPFSFFNDDDENANRGLVSFLIAPGLHWKFKPTENSHVTIGADLQYSPYRLKGAIEQDIGGLSISPKILYQF